MSDNSSGITAAAELERQKNAEKIAALEKSAADKQRQIEALLAAKAREKRQWTQGKLQLLAIAIIVITLACGAGAVLFFRMWP